MSMSKEEEEKRQSPQQFHNAFLVDKFIIGSRYANEYIKTLISLDIHKYAQEIEKAGRGRGNEEYDNTFNVIDLKTRLHISQHTSISYSVSSSIDSSGSTTTLPLIRSADPSLFK